jgi:hypothetical protein
MRRCCLRCLENPYSAVSDVKKEVFQQLTEDSGSLENRPPWEKSVKETDILFDIPMK